MADPTTDRGPWTFNHNYNDTEQVRTFLADFLTAHHDITRQGDYPYNTSFKGRIPGLANATSKNEDTAIYLLQTLKRLDEIRARVDAALAEGLQPLDSVTEPRRYARVVEYGFYMGGTGWREWTAARVVPYGRRGRMILAKGKRTNGHIPTGQLLVAEHDSNTKLGPAGNGALSASRPERRRRPS